MLLHNVASLQSGCYFGGTNTGSHSLDIWLLFSKELNYWSSVHLQHELARLWKHRSIESLSSSWRIHVAQKTWEKADVRRREEGLCSVLISGWSQVTKGVEIWTLLELGVHFPASSAAFQNWSCLSWCYHEVWKWGIYLSNLSNQACQPALQANPENLSGCKSVLLTSNSKLCSQYYNTNSTIRGKAHFLCPEKLKGSWILSSKGKNRQNAVQADI